MKERKKEKKLIKIRIMEDKINELERAMQHIEREQRYSRLVERRRQRLHEEVEEEKGLDAEVWEGLLQEAKRIENGFRNIEKVQLIKEEKD